MEKIKNAFPNTSILIISTADKDYRYDGEWHTEKGVLPLTDVQYSLASDAGFDFLNLYNAMGGADAMRGWVEQDPPLANKDYTHVNHRGATKLAGIIYKAIADELYDFQKHDN